MSLVKSLIIKLDQNNSLNDAGNVHVVFLKNADASKLAVTLRAATSTSCTGSCTRQRPCAQHKQGAAAGVSQQLPATGGQIQADLATNSLIITAPDPQYRQLRAIIDQLDSRRAQVYVESLIAEINSDKAAEFGIQWQNALRATELTLTI